MDTKTNMTLKISYECIIYVQFTSRDKKEDKKESLQCYSNVVLFLK